ncbi:MULTISPECIES: carbamoyltransferase HypF [Enterobacter]|uniref:carbamoyltransferase HypF n=1 Tax=Enterobacter TaxID=547 RepID=UPI00048920B7|nr:MULTISPECIES: carbamoyltransferase HypF [Enterobacter cloacae complex]HDT2074908.1 carbamoyltransferase HypF [Enterobacter roggenkampii]HEG2000373.1 carbamoyltransferase HypF [Enterobacter asburiae]MCD2459183.1 carbamoyltransferase HypF [Enterobacter cloacae complex sp. 2021EL-01261]MDT9876456.1 carbamoyltransferase HypF [Enterobacter cloacae]HDT2095590.1 carbamoyltransferase HypF [Enterobacter roggenkampii]
MCSNGVQLRVRGKVQGVGFRPFVWQLAQSLQLSGDVCNDGEGVLVRLAGNGGAFTARLRQDCPPLARIDAIDLQPFTWRRVPEDFTIRHSAGGAMDTQIVPDAATCPACLAEMRDPRERRYRYPFINCTHCGPRFTIIRAMPYDRPATSMATFPLCEPCETEYRNPADRRFHAQPVACPDCGPELEWRAGDSIATRESALSAAVEMLKNGGIVAIKGLGGFHLACDALNPQAVARLRTRKQRPSKPLAVMIPQAEALPTAIQTLLCSPAAPIVLTPKVWLPALPDEIAPGLDSVGIMLPANPLQHLLMLDCQRPLVMTSGNLSGKPPAISNQQALDELGEIADGFLLHNRDIVQRMDDSVLLQDGTMLRRARGFVPDAITLPAGFSNIPAMLCTGSEMKNTFCLVRGNQAVLSQHFGDLSDEGVEAQWRSALAVMQQIYTFQPERVVCDAHPGYHTRQWAHEQALPVDTVLHHHAHAAACLAENGWPLDGGDVIALTLDGIGMGENGALWGGECLRVNYCDCEHLGGLPAVALPGGDLAAVQPWRNLLAHCLAFVPDWQHYPETRAVQRQNWPLLATAIGRGVNAPLASSCGRLFDAIACALGIETQRYESEAACRLEALASQCAGVAHPVTLSVDNLSLFWQQWLNWQAEPCERAWAFHDALAKGLAQLVKLHAMRLSLSTVCFSGGVLHNRLLRARLRHYLSDFTLLFPSRLPAGDGAISFGQAVVAAARSCSQRT